MRKFSVFIVVFLWFIGLYGNWKDVWNDIYKRKNYSCIITSIVWHNGKSEFNVYKYKYDNGNIYMGYIDGANKGAEIWYYKDKNKVRAHRGGILSKIILTLSPNDKKLKNKRGRGVLDTDFTAYMSLLDTTNIKIEEKQDTIIISGDALKNEENIEKVKYIFIKSDKWNLTNFYAWDKNGPAYKMTFDYNIED